MAIEPGYCSLIDAFGAGCTGVSASAVSTEGARQTRLDEDPSVVLPQQKPRSVVE
jgi:hypothetical protein